MWSSSSRGYSSSEMRDPRRMPEVVEPLLLLSIVVMVRSDHRRLFDCVCRYGYVYVCVGGCVSE